MINYTTPSISLTVEGKDWSAMDVYVTLEQGCIELTKTGTDLTITTETHEQITDTNIIFVLSQEESAKFAFNSSVAVQVNAIDSNGVREATEIKTVGVMRNLLDEVIQYGN